VVAFSGSGDREPSAFDGIDAANQPAPVLANFNGICTDATDVPPAVPDGHLNDYESQFVKSHTGAIAGTSPEQHLWQMLVSAPGHQSVLIDLSGNGTLANAITDDRGDVASGAISTRPFTLNGDPQCGIDTFACNIGLGTIALPLIQQQQGFGVVTGTVRANNGLPLANVTVVLTDSRGQVFTTLTNAAGFYFFTGVFPGAANIVYADNINDYGASATAGGTNFGPATGCLPGAPCGHLPLVQSNVSIPNATFQNTDVTLQVKFAPTAAELLATLPTATVFPGGTVGVFGYVVTAAGGACTQGGTPGAPCGVGGVVITATAAGQPTLTTVTDFGTGRWRIVGLTPATSYTFTATFTGATGTANALSCATFVSAAATPFLSAAVGNTCTDTVVTPTTAGNWADPVFVIVTPPVQSVVVPPVNFGFITGTVVDSAGLPVAGTLVTLYQLSTQTTLATTTNLNGQYAFFQLGPANAPAGVAACITLAAATATSPAGTGCAGLTPDTYTVTVVDTRFPLTCQPGPGVIGGPITQPVCGGLPAATTVTLGANQVLNTTTTAALAFRLADKIPPGGAVPGGLAGVFGYVIESATGAPIPGAIISFSTGSGAPQFAAQVAQTDVTGRYQVTLSTGVAYTATLTLPPGFAGACTVGAGAPIPAIPVVCNNGVGTGFTSFPIGAAALTAGRWHDGASFVLASTITSFPPGGTAAEALQSVVLPIFRNPDTSFTGVDLETVQVRVMNNGPIRTGVRIFWWQTASDETVSVAKVDEFDLNPAGVAIFTRSFVPDGCTRCYAEVWSVDRDLQGIATGLADLQTTVTTRVVEADNAIAGNNGMSNEDLFPASNTAVSPGVPQFQTITVGGQTFTVQACVPGVPGCPVGFNEQYTLPVVFKNYGGGVHKWNSVISACMTRNILPGVGGVQQTSGAGQPVVFAFAAMDQTPSVSQFGPLYQVTRAVNPGGCAVINLGRPDPDDVELGGIGNLPDGTYSVYVRSTGGTLIPLPTVNSNRPGAFFASTINYTTTGKMATAFNGSLGSAGETAAGGALANVRQVYGGLVFKRYNDWNSGVVLSHPGTAQNMDTTITFYGEDGTVVGTMFDRINNQTSRAYYLPTLPIQIPDGFRGAVIASGQATDVTPFPFFTPGTNLGVNSRLAGGAHHVNYERNQAMSYNLTIGDHIALPTAANQTSFINPCLNNPNVGLIPGGVVLNPLLPAGSQNPGTLRACLAVPALERAVAARDTPNGPTTGIRLYHPDVDRTGRPAVVNLTYVDASGVFQNESLTQLVIPPFGTATVFVGADTRLPDFFTGTAIVTSDVPLVGFANVVDYSVNTRDGSWAYNLPNQRGFTN
jgi:hypothetical protein